jgi:hypothetical protein
VVSVLDKDGKPVQDAVVVVTPANKSAVPKNAAGGAGHHQPGKNAVHPGRDGGARGLESEFRQQRPLGPPCAQLAGWHGPVQRDKCRV